jgi:hypothetical protein
MAAEIAVKGADLDVGAVRPLFGPIAGGDTNWYGVSADGQRFLVITPDDQAAAAPLTLVQNWTAGLKK